MIKVLGLHGQLYGLNEKLSGLNEKSPCFNDKQYDLSKKLRVLNLKNHRTPAHLPIICVYTILQRFEYQNNL